jgi:hypothetical protein
MGRIRTIKPEFWRHEALSELPAETHMLAAALLNYADDEGYFNANPKLVQAECFPLRDLSVTVQCSITHLSNVGFITLGTGADGRRYGHIAAFMAHQVINRPKASKISTLEISWNNHGRITDPSPPEQGTGNREKEQGKGTGNGEHDGDANASLVVSPEGEPDPVDDEPDDLPIKYDLTECGKAVKAWNVMAARAGLASVQKLTTARRRSLVRRLADCGGLDGWCAALDKVENTPGLLGTANGEGHGDWRADFDFLLKESKFTKLMEGGYDNWTGNSNGDRSPHEAMLAGAAAALGGRGG